MIIYFVRHGETEWNKKGIIQGHKDSVLTLNGKAAAEKLGKILSNRNIEMIYTSDLGRCVQAAEIINKYLKVKLVKTKELRERSFGSLNGKSEKEVKKKLDLSNLNEVAPNGESFNQLKKRIVNFIKLLSKKNLKTVLLVIHHGSARAILSEYYRVNSGSKKCDTRPDRVYKIKGPYFFDKVE